MTINELIVHLQEGVVAVERCDELQAELTKARELLLPAAHRLSDLGQTHLSEPMFTFWLATDQSAPADKGQV